MGTVMEMDTTEHTIREKIEHVLRIYPQISVSMLQVGIGTSMMPSIWKPILEKMIEEGVIVNTAKAVKTPTGRDQTYTILSLADKAD